MAIITKPDGNKYCSKCNGRLIINRKCARCDLAAINREVGKITRTGKKTRL